MLEINRQRVKDTFAEYASHYDVDDPKIKLKIDHTYRVAGLSQRIARALGLEDEEMDLAWLIGMLHDVGRFEQLRRFGTFSDADSIDHAQFGAKLLFEDGLIDGYLPAGENSFPAAQNVQTAYSQQNGALDNQSARKIIHTAIWNHSAYRIEQGLGEYAKMYCQIIRDADKIDILKVNHDVPIEEIYNVTTQELKQSQVTPAVMEAFFERHAILRRLKKTPVDNIVGHSALVFELVYPVSYQIVKEQGYLDKILGFHSDNPVTNKQFQEMRACMGMYLAENEAKKKRGKTHNTAAAD